MIDLSCVLCHIAIASNQRRATICQRYASSALFRPGWSASTGDEQKILQSGWLSINTNRNNVHNKIGGAGLRFIATSRIVFFCSSVWALKTMKWSQLDSPEITTKIFFPHTYVWTLTLRWHVKTVMEMFYYFDRRDHWAAFEMRISLLEK